jgi:5-methylcytosine-specific restriction protein A
MYPFMIDKEYRKKDIYEIIRVPTDTHGGNWDTGYNFFNNDFFIFANINIPGRTGHNYENRFEGDLFRWYAKSYTKLNNPQIQLLLNPPEYVYIFYRFDNSKPYIFAGTGIPFSYQDTSPVQITWKILNNFYEEHFSQKEYTILKAVLKEGARHEHIVNIYERNPEARKRCIDIYGYTCSVCDFDFAERYGELGKDFIHVHHIKPLAEIKGDYSVNPEKDLRPVCPNCHAMIHRTTPPLKIEELKKLLR